MPFQTSLPVPTGDPVDMSDDCLRAIPQLPSQHPLSAENVDGKQASPVGVWQLRNQLTLSCHSRNGTVLVFQVKSTEELNIVSGTEGGTQATVDNRCRVSTSHHT